MRHLTPTEYLTRDLLSGSLDVGTLDSLARDARAAKVSYGAVDAEALVGSLRIVGQGNRAVIAVDEAGVGYLQSLVFARYLMHYNVYGHYALRIPTVMFLRAVQDALQTENTTSEQLAQQDDAGALALITKSAAPESSSATLVKRLGDRRPYKRAIEFDERHSSYASLIRLRDDASWRRRVEEAWSHYLTRYRKGVAGPFDILIDLPEKRRFDVGLRLIRRSPSPASETPSPGRASLASPKKTWPVTTLPSTASVSLPPTTISQLPSAATWTNSSPSPKKSDKRTTMLGYGPEVGKEKGPVFYEGETLFRPLAVPW